jgi:metal-responsive CopG/Arc/MetJ family transcriptional regulator
VALVTEVTVATKIGSEELKRIDAIVRRRGLMNRSDLVREAIRLYLSLSSLETEARLRMLRLINESVGVSGKSAGQLIEAARKEEDA